MPTPQTDVIITRDGQELGRYIVEPGEYLIGRSKDCGLHVVADLVSRYHARLIVHEDHLEIEDSGSANGTFINGKPAVGVVRLWPNQKVTVGTATIEFKRRRVSGDSTQSLAPQVAAVRQILPEEFLRDRRYEIGGMVAQGGMGAILDARETTTERMVAMKVMLASATPEDVVRFVAEAKITGQLEHPNIVPVHELGVDANEQVFYTMKFVRGITLKKALDLIAAGVPETIKKYSLGNLLTVFQKVCDALAFAHSKGVIHRDLKPENIMIGDFGEVLVMDWGIAKLVNERPAASAASPASPALPPRSIIRMGTEAALAGSSTLAGAIMGTPEYMAPEQARGEVETLDVRADIYALGAVLYHLLALRAPLQGDDAQTLVARAARGKIDPLPTGRRRDGRALPHLPDGQVPDSLAAVVRKAMALDPAQRYASVPELQHEIEAFQNGFATSAERAGLGKQMRLLVRRHKTLTAAAALIAVLLVAFAVNVFVSQRRLKATFQHLKSTAPTFHAQALALIEESPSRPAALDEALANIEHAIELAPENATFRATKGQILQTLLRLSEARTAFTQALHRDSSQRFARENIGLCEALMREGSGKEISAAAIGALQKALQQQGRLAESIALMSRGGTKDKARIAEAWGAVLKKAGIDRKPTVFDDGLLGLNLNGLPLDNLSALKGMPIADLTVPEKTGVTDLSPLVGMPLRRLWCANTNVSDLWPLSGMPLKDLAIQNTQVADLSPLSGMPLEILTVTALVDLSVLRELPLRSLNIANSRFPDLKALEGLKLTRLVASTAGVSDLSPLKGMPLEELDVNNNYGLRDLSPLAGMPLKRLVVRGTSVSNISALQGLPLEDLELSQTLVTDLRPVAGAPIRLLQIADTPFTAFDQLKAFGKLEFLNLERTTIVDLEPLAGSSIQCLDLRNSQRLKEVSQLTALPALKAVALPLHIRDAAALRGKPGMVWIGYNSVPRPWELANKKAEWDEFWKMNLLERQLIDADPQGQLHTSKFPYMTRRFGSSAKSFDGRWYRSYGLGMTWKEAARFAAELGGHLVTITSLQEDEFVRKNILGISGGRLCWIGARSEQPGGPWRWTTGEPWGFERWGRNAGGPMEPNGATKPSAQPDLFVGYVNTGTYLNSPAWNDVPDDAPNADALIIEWEK